ncbi:RNA polymerase III RPC4-domain-containing protein [Mycena polygramma]|nr:RNA polymerase III RPC4-domain-containing protein [Mycena polygramma]
MSDNASGSGAGPSKAIGSLAKKPADVTRQGTQKFKFTPVLPARRQKPECRLNQEPKADVVPPESSRGRGRGRGRGEGRGRGRGNAPRAPIEMTASGPFAMGPAMSGNNARRSVPRSNFAIPNPSVDRSSLGAGLSQEEEVYSEPDEGVEIVDMEDVRQMDWMAPESLRKERRHAKKVKKEEPTEHETEAAAVEEVEVDAANALDLSESEEEEEFEDLIEHFARQENINEDPTMREERLYFFQFPSPFPTFSPPAVAVPDDIPEVVDTGVKKVSFADDVKAGSLPGSARGSMAPPETPVVDKVEENPVIDGLIGTLEVYRSGAVKMRLQNGMLLDVTAATQPSFLQHAVCLDFAEKRLTVLGEVNKRFVVSPDIDTLLTAMEVSERSAARVKAEDAKMDTT